MDLHACILYLYPDAVAFRDFELMALDKGAFINKWHLDVPQPTVDQLEYAWTQVLKEREKAEERAKVQAEVDDLKSYLSTTDFYYLRQIETDEPVPEDVKDKRLKARARLKELGL